MASTSNRTITSISMKNSQMSLFRRMNNHDSRNRERNLPDRFIHACENGDYRTVHEILEENPQFNIDVANQLGRTAMQLAIQNEHLEIVTLLLAYCDGPKMREALLLAIYLGHVQIAEACLRHPKFKTLNERQGIIADDENTFWDTTTTDDAQFSPDITPLILAAQHNRTEIVQLLLNDGNRITKPHNYHCKCQVCRNKFKFDSLRLAQSRLNAYRGLASESYISLASIDPILTAFELGRELRDLSEKEKYFKNEYIKLADQLSAYAVKLLDKVRGHQELDCVLGKTGKESEEKYVLLARLYLAIQYAEKPFVAHSNCQQKLVEIWHSQLRNLFKLNPLILLLLSILYIFLLPFLCALYILTSWCSYTTKLQRFLKQPCLKFFGHTLSYIIFISLIIISSLLFASELQKPLKRLSIDYPSISSALNISRTYHNTENKTHICYIYPTNDLVFRADKPTWIDLTISVFVVGFLWHELKQAYKDGFRDYLLSWNNIIDSYMNILYISSFLLKFYVIYNVISSNSILENPQFVEKTQQICSLNETEQIYIYNVLYWLNADRFYWVSFDPINVAEGLFALANILSFSRICFLLPAFQHLGPLQISLGRMMSDIGKFIIIFTIIFCGFMFGLNNLFWYYEKSVRNEVEINLRNASDELPAEKYFGTMSITFKTVFWSLFGLAEKNGVQLGNYNNRFTEMVGYILYGAFNIAIVIVLLNMLIAMMSKSYETIEEHADVEWKFARSKLYMEYIREGGILPVPFNLIPTIKDIIDLVAQMFTCLKNLNRSNSKKSNTIQKYHFPSTLREKTFESVATGISTISDGRIPVYQINDDRQFRHGSFDINQTITYRIVMRRIIKRFLLNKQREEQEAIHKGDFEQLKQDIQMLRFELLNRLDETRDDLCRNSQVLNEAAYFTAELLSTCLMNDTKSTVERFKNKHSISDLSNDTLQNVKLANIIEEDDNLSNSIKFIDDEDEDLFNTDF